MRDRHSLDGDIAVEAGGVENFPIRDFLRDEINIFPAAEHGDKLTAGAEKIENHARRGDGAADAAKLNVPQIRRPQAVVVVQVPALDGPHSRGVLDAAIPQRAVAAVLQ